MNQSEFDAELASGKRSWDGTHVPGDLDVSGREIYGNVNFHDMCIDGDLDLSNTIIHGMLNLFEIRVKGELNLSGLQVDRLQSCHWGDSADANGLTPYGLVCIEGEIVSHDLMVGGKPLRLPPHSIAHLYRQSEE